MRFPPVRIVAVPILLALSATIGLAQAPALSPDAIDSNKFDLEVIHVQGNVYMLAGAGANITLQVGDDGVLLVDAGLAAASDKVFAEISKLSSKRIRYIVDTSAEPNHIGGVAALAKRGIPSAAQGGPPFNGATIIATVKVGDRMIAAVNSQKGPVFGVPNDEYATDSKDFYFNGEAIFVYRAPAAHSDADSMVYFRRSDVLSAGEVFTPETYPAIDVEQGGSVQGEIAALNHILDLTVPAAFQEGGTYVIPAHGRICEESDVLEYRDMVTIVRDRIQDLMKKHMTLDQVKAAKPTLDYDRRYGSGTGKRSKDAFIEAIYQSLSEKK
jgi:cyclase